MRKHKGSILKSLFANNDKGWKRFKNNAKKKNRVKKNSKRYIETPKREVQAKVK